MGSQVTSKKILFTISIIYTSLVMVIMVFTGISYWLAINQVTKDTSLSDVFVVLVPAVLITGLVSGYFIFNALTKKIPATATLREKLIGYQTALLIRSACLEFPALFCGVATIITGELTFLYTSGVVLFIFFALRPTANSITADLQLSMTERSLLQNPDAVLYEL